AVVRTVDKTLRTVRAGTQGQGEALCATSVHHRRRRSAAGLSALRARGNRQRRPAAQYLPRDASEQSATRADQEGGDEPSGERTGNARRQRAREFWQDLGCLWSSDQRR